MKSPRFLSALLLVLPLAGTPAAAAPGSPAPYAAPAAATDPAARIIDRITDAVGLKARFTVVASDAVPNAAAVTINGQRCILYNPDFMRAINRATRTNWSAVGVLAHEIGHHLNGHTLSADPRNQATSYRDELEADEFSGFVLRRMGASSDESVAALSLLAAEEDSPTHPPRSARLSAVAQGWNSASGQAAPAVAQRTAAPAPTPQAEPVSVPVRPAAVTHLNPAAIAGRLTFDQAPDEVLYLTRQLHVVADGPGGARVLGALRQTTSRRYPFQLVKAGTGATLYVTAQGIVVDPAGRRVGQLELG